MVPSRPRPSTGRVGGGVEQQDTGPLYKIERTENALENLMKDKGCAHPSVVALCVQLCDLLNLEALRTLHTEEIDNALTLLRKAEILAANTSLVHEAPCPVVAVTFNNIACCLKRKGKLRTALQVSSSQTKPSTSFLL